MKKMLILSWLILFFTPMVWAQERCEAPTLNIGDKWVYSDKSGRKWTQEVVGIEKDIYVIRYPLETRGYDKSTMNFNFIIDQNNRRTKFTSHRSKVLDFPLYTGKKWSNNISYATPTAPERESSCQERHFVSSYEDVKVLAGTFKAFKIEFRSECGVKGRSATEIGKGAYWYSPEVKAIIKRVEEVAKELADLELISFTLK